MLVGLTGAPGCGKSTVLKIFGALGWRTLDADAICHSIYEEPEGWLGRTLAERWGAGVIGAEGRPDRAAIAKIVFSDRGELEWLNSILHPEIERRALKSLEGAECPAIFDAPLLFEAGWQKVFKCVVAVWTSPATQMERLLKRGWSRDEALRRIASQLPAERKLEMADCGIVNDCPMETLRRQCEILDGQIKLKYK